MVMPGPEWKFTRGLREYEYSYSAGAGAGRLYSQHVVRSSTPKRLTGVDVEATGSKLSGSDDHIQAFRIGLWADLRLIVRSTGGATNVDQGLLASSPVCACPACSVPAERAELLT